MTLFINEAELANELRVKQRELPPILEVWGSAASML